MSNDPRLMDLLECWERARDSGQPVTPEELCRDTPELLDPLRCRIALLVGLDPLVKPASSLAALPTVPPSLAATNPRSGAARQGPHSAPGSPMRFRILHHHAAGGLGDVFVALDEELKREIALKQIQTPYAHNPDFRQRFLLEAEVTGRLEHPGIVPVYGLGVDGDGRPYYAMRFIRGESLKHAVKRFHAADKPNRNLGERNQALRGLLARFVAVCNAIAYAHSRGILHRDIKPDNVMLGPYGETLVVDWGLAKAVGRNEHDRALGEGTLTPQSIPGSTYGAVGTPAYMSPEQAAARQSLMGPPSDVYSLGATLYHLLTGYAPLEPGRLDEILEKVQRGEFHPPRHRNKAVPRSLEAVCLKAMALKREDRYASAVELAQDVEAWLADEPVKAQPELLRERARRWLKRRRTAVLTTLAAGVVALVALAASTVLLNAANQRERGARGEAEASAIDAAKQRDAADLHRTKAELARDDANRARRAADVARTAAEASENLKRQQLYATNINLAWQSWQAGSVVRARRFLRELMPERGKEDLRGFEWHYLQHLCHAADPFTLRGHTSAITSLAFSPDGKFLASAGADGVVLLWDAASRRILRSFSPDPMDLSGVLGVEWQQSRNGIFVQSVNFTSSADLDGRLQEGDRLVSISGPDGNPVPAGKLTLKQLTSLERGQPGTPADLEVVPFGQEKPQRYTLLRRRDAGERDRGVLNLSGSERLSFYAGKQAQVAFSRDGRWLATAANTSLILWDAHTGGRVHSLKGHRGPILGLRFAPSGKWLASIDFTGELVLWEPESGKKHAVFQHPPMFINGASMAVPFAPLDWAPDSKTVMVGELGRIFLWDPEKKQRQETLIHDNACHAMTVVAGGALLAMGQSTLGDYLSLYDPALRRSFPLSGHKAAVHALAASADGSILASGSHDQTVRLWDLVNRRPLRLLPGHTRPVSAVAIAADGQSVASGDLGGVLILRDSFATPESVNWDSWFRNRAEFMAFSPDGKTLVSSAARLGVEIRDAHSGKQRAILPLREQDKGAAFSPDGKILATYPSDVAGINVTPGVCRVWNVATGKLRHELRGHAHPILGATFTPDSKQIVTTGGIPRRDAARGEIRFWDLQTGRCVKEFPTPRPVGLPLFTPAGKTLITAIAPHLGRPLSRIDRWDVATGRSLGPLVNDIPLYTYSLALSADGKVLAASLSNDSRGDGLSGVNEVRLYSVESGKELARLSDQGGPVLQLAFSPDGKTLATACMDRITRVHDVTTGRVLHRLHQSAIVNSVSFSPDGKTLALGVGAPQSKTSHILLCDTTSWKSIGEIRSPAGVAVGLFAPRDSSLFVRISDGDWWLYDAKTHQLLHSLQESSPAKALLVHTTSIACLAIASDNKTLATGGRDQTVLFWDFQGPVDSDLALARPPTKVLTTPAPVASLAFSPDGRMLAVGTGGGEHARAPGELILWDRAENKVRWRLSVAPAGVSALVFTPDSQTVIFIADDLPAGARSSEVRLVDAGSGKIRASVCKGSFTAHHLALSRDGNHLAIDAIDGSGGNPLQLVDLATGTVQRLAGHTNPVNALVFLADGRTLVSAAQDGAIRFWQVNGGRELFSITKATPVFSLAVSPDGATLALGGEEGRDADKIQLLRTGSSELLYQALVPPGPGGHSRWVRTRDPGQLVSEEAYFDKQGKPARSVFGYHFEVTRLNPSGGWREKAYFDENGKPARNPNNVHRRTTTYDAQGRLIGAAYFDDRNKPMRTKPGYAQLRFRYDEEGKPPKTEYLDLDGSPLEWQVEIVVVKPGTPGAKLGLRLGDVLIRYDGKKITNGASFLAMRKGEKPGDPTRPLIVRRDGKDFSVDVSPGRIEIEMRDRLVRPSQ